MRHERGFTLIELMITLVIAGVLISIAVPAFSDLIRSNRITTQVNSVVRAMNYARSEAVKKSAPVSVCASTDQSSCSGNKGWDKGWIVFSDDNGNGDMDASDVILRVNGALDSTSLQAASNDHVTYQPSGRPDNTLQLTLDPDDCRGQEKRQLDVKASGMTNVESQAC